ncbi:MAG TPA: hypothetical protein VEK36_02070 [Candidatus Paceibacterota bacterium]|nr:hypothetical protein [Candidatus Paceibacterota bacterium]
MAATTTKQLIEIAEIRDSVIVLKNGSLRMILEISAINFELRSEEEQTAILQNFQRFLNSIDFPLQMAINSRKFDLAEYVKTIQDASAQLTNELLKIQAQEYIKFIQELSELANIMSKRFYIVLPFYILETPSGKGILDSIKNVFKSKKPTPIAMDKLETYKNQLLQRAELVFDGLVGMGLKTRILEGQELINLFYGLYNPSVKTQNQ